MIRESRRKQIDHEIPFPFASTGVIDRHAVQSLEEQGISCLR